MHRAFQKAIDGDKSAYIQARLWYQVYVCDHHFSIPYGRPPMVAECEAVRSVSKFLMCPYSNENDSRLASQVELWVSASRMLTDFGFDVDVPISVESISRLRRFMISLDTWRADRDTRFEPNFYIGEYPRKGVGLHYHFAKLYLCSHALRGLASRPPH
jgi:hypothetical protein